jgi:GGDEF domain-containing protein/HD-like signal output (HDOD) protein
MDTLRHILPACAGRAVDARRLGDLIRQDDALAARLEGYVNLFFTRFEGRIAGGERALRVCGGQVGALLALVDAVVQSMEGHHGTRAAGLLWADALSRGCAARALAQVDRSADPDLCFALGVTRSLGALRALAGDPDRQLRWWRTVRRARGMRRRSAEEAVVGPDPMKAVRPVLADWGLPEVLIQVLEADQPTAVEAPWQETARILGQADALVEALGAVDAGVALQIWVEQAGTTPGIPATGAWTLVQDVLETVPAAARALSVPCSPWPSLAELRGRHVRLEPVGLQDELAILVDLQATALDAARRARRTAEDALVDRLRVDPVTDLPTLQVFSARLAAALADPGTDIGALAAIRLEDFGATFAREGLRTTDRLLARVAEALDRTFPEAELITRISGATFVVAVPGAPRMARIQVERARVALARLTVPGVDGPVGIRPRLGLLDLSDLPLDVPAEALLEAARRTAGLDAEASGLTRLAR